MKKNLNKELYHGYKGAEQFIAVPLKYQEESTLNPQPNFLVIEKVFGFQKVPLMQPTGVEELIECQNTLMKLVYREILPKTSSKEEIVREIVMDEIGNIFLPFIYIPSLRNQLALSQNKPLIDTWMTMFSFRGVLEGFKVEYDVTKSVNYLQMPDYLPEEGEVIETEPTE